MTKMVRLIADHGYSTSRDYDLLADLMQKTAVICFIDYVWSDGDVTRDVAATVYRHGSSSSESFDISCRGTSYLWVSSREQFIWCCHKYNVEFVVPEKVHVFKDPCHVELLAYRPDGHCTYHEFDHWPARKELPADAVRFDMVWAV